MDYFDTFMETETLLLINRWILFMQLHNLLAIELYSISIHFLGYNIKFDITNGLYFVKLELKDIYHKT
jgi:hypothetical protein